MKHHVMSRHDTRIKMSKRNFLLALALLVVTHVVTNIVLMVMYKNSLSGQIKQRMLDITNTASYMLDGDVLATLQADDTQTPEYQESLQILQTFEENIELSYIYCVRNDGNDRFVFIIDPDSKNPASFGEEILTTPALLTAYQGTPSVDKKPHEDEWGRFYSAYSPVFDSNGNVTGIVGVDFDADWYDNTLNSHRAVSVILIMVALTIGIALSFVIMSQNRKRFSIMLKSLAELDMQAQELDRLITKSSIKKLDLLPNSENTVLQTLASGEKVKRCLPNEYDQLSTSIAEIYEKLQKYLTFVYADVYTDDTTGVCNKASYKKKVKELDDSITSKKGNFAVAFFDINGLKKIYVHFGYEAGDKLLFECAKILKDVFGKKSVFHITGDEFVILADGQSKFDMERFFAQFDDEIQKYNLEHDKDNHLSVAKGVAIFDPEQHPNYRSVFIQAKADCDRDKEEYYQRFKQ